MLEVRGVTKRYGKLLALDDVNAVMHPGEIHAVVGENGAGKSTLMGILAGFITPDSGSCSLNGSAIPLGHPAQCRSLGIQMVHQHFMLVPEFTVQENLALGSLRSVAGNLDLDAATQVPLEMAKQLGWALDERARTGSLPVGTQQKIEILKAVSEESNVLILDEPTAVLLAEQVEDLFRVLRQLRDEGRIIILIAHKLSEIMAIADRVTVLRKGRVVAESLISETNADELAFKMVGEIPPLRSPLPVSTQAVALSVRGLTVLDDRKVEVVRGVDLEIRDGEIVGIGGVDGNGQVELAEAIAGIRKPKSGTVSHAQVAYLPQDRQVDGLALNLSIFDNLMIAGHRKEALRWGPFLRIGLSRDWAREQVRIFAIKTDSIDRPAKSLSGGNQQKVVVARALSDRPEVLVAINPTRGLDVHGMQAVHRFLLEAAEAGTAILLFSTDLDELAALSTRMLFMSQGALHEATASSLVGSA